MTPAGSSLPNRVAKRAVDGRTYCVKADSEGAAGTVYTAYDYSAIKNDTLMTISFVLTYPQCDNYGEPQRTKCRSERGTFDLDSVVDRIAQSITQTGGAEPSLKPVQSNKGAILGTVLLGPTCPVMKNPPDPQCADKPAAAKLVLTTADQSYVITEFSSNINGKFSLQVVPGEYAIRSAAAANILPICSSREAIKVSANTLTETTVYCDTGIR